MNFTEINKPFEYWHEHVMPLLSTRLVVSSFDDYLKKFASLPSGKWLREYNEITLVKIPLLVNPKEFLSTYKDKCIAYHSPVRAEEGMQKIIYQLSPTLHVEATLWIISENKVTVSYMVLIACFHKKPEFDKFLKDMIEIKLTEDTSYAAAAPGFLGFRNDESNKSL